MGRACLAAALTAFACASLPAVVAAGQSVAGPAGASGVPPTAWGDPDLQGTWTNTTTTPLQRPPELAGRERFTLEERAALDEARARTEARACATELVVLQHEPPPTSTGSYNSFWLEQGTRTLQTSLIVDPPDGRLPSVTPRAQRRADALAASRASSSYPATWEEPSVFERCITRGLPATMMPGFYNHNYQILQTPDHVVILVEMIHDARIIPMDGRAHVNEGIRQWLGDSRGRWEGDTLVVETTNLPHLDQRGVAVFGTSEQGRVVERFTRIDENAMDYRVTVDDPATFTAEWTASIPMRRIDGPIYEYACHEGNYGLTNILAGHRKEEAEAAALAASK